MEFPCTWLKTGLISMSTKSLGLSDQLHNYLLSVSVPEDPLWEQLCIETIESVGFNMQISPEQAQFMSLLINLIGAKMALEIGTFTGYSALTIARALPENGQLIACDTSEEWTAIAKRYWTDAGVDKKIDLKIAPALTTLDKLIAKGLENSFDFAFIDADKPNYINYYEKCLTLVRVGGIVCVDNTLWGGSVADPGKTDIDTESIRDLNKRMFADERTHSSLVPIGDGLHIALKKA